MTQRHWQASYGNIPNDIDPDAYRSVAGPTGRGLTADICTYSHADLAEPPRPGTRAARTTASASSGLGIIRPTSLCRYSQKKICLKSPNSKS